jgi:DNA sulfur modification protein DndB
MKLIPAISGKLGTTEYWIATMKASEVVNSLQIPKEMPDWGNESIEERYQREINYKRVKEQIAPYLAQDEDRFFSALIVDMINGDEVTFDPLGRLVQLPALFEKLGNCFGILTLQGSETLVPLDGQHRLCALKFALLGRDQEGKTIDTFTHNPQIADDDITLILVRHDRKRARKIFNKVNRYAKAVSKADNLIISEDDYIAIVSRDIGNNLFHGLVNSVSNTIPDKSNDVTTLSTLYEATLEYLAESVIYPRKVNTEMLPSPEDQHLLRLEAEKLWKAVLRNMDVFSDALGDREESGKAKRVELRSSYILMKPIVQHALVGAIKLLMLDGMSLDDAIAKASRLDWRFDCEDWERVAVLPGDKIITGAQSRRLLSRIIAYRLGLHFDSKELEILETQYKRLFDNQNRSLPPLLH